MRPACCRCRTPGNAQKRQQAGRIPNASRNLGDAAFTFLARDTASPRVDNRALLVAGKPEVHQYRAIYVLGDAGVGLLSNELIMTTEP